MLRNVDFKRLSGVCRQPPYATVLKLHIGPLSGQAVIKNAGGLLRGTLYEG